MSHIQITQLMAEANEPGHALGVVLDVENGHGLTLLSKGRQIAVYAHGVHVPYLQKGDEVLFVGMDGGAYIIARSRKPGEIPPLSFAPNPSNLSLQTAQGQLFIDSEGNIQ